MNIIKLRASRGVRTLLVLLSQFGHTRGDITTAEEDQRQLIDVRENPSTRIEDILCICAFLETQNPALEVARVV